MSINNLSISEDVESTKAENLILQEENDTFNKLLSSRSDTNTWAGLVPIFLIFLVFYFLLIRPQEKQRRIQQNLVSSVKCGEEVLTNAGIIGIINKINDADNTVLISVAKNVEIKMLKTSVSEILSRKNSSDRKPFKS